MDSGAYLAVVIITLVHNFSMNSLGLLEIWVDQIERDLNFIVVTKLNFHIRECLKVSQEMNNYLRIFCVIAEDMISEDPDAVHMAVTPGVLRRQALRGLKEDAVEVPLNSSKYFELSPSTMEPFLGPIGIRTFPFLIDGNVLYEVQGTEYWQSQLSIYFDRLSKLSQLYTKKLDEKRNFWSFVLTIVSIAQFPLGAMTGYWGMNVAGLAENELDSDWWPTFPGYKFFWFVAAVIYFVLFAFLIHTRVIYSAS